MKRWFWIEANSDDRTKQTVKRLLVRPWGVLLLVSATWMSIGCDSDSFVPPRPDELKGVAGAENDSASGLAARVGVPASTKPIELILDRHSAEETEFFKSAARTQAGIEKARIKLTFLGEKESATRQAELVREAVARRPPALILELADPNDLGLAKAVREAEDAGVPVILLGRPLAGSQATEVAQPDAKAAKAGAGPASVQGQAQGAQASAGSRPPAPLILVSFGSFAPTSKALVASAARNTKNMGNDPHGGAVILLDSTSDLYVEQRATAMRDALNVAGITKIKEIRFEKSATRVEPVLSEFLRANPDFVMVFPLDHQSYLANRKVSTDLRPERPLISAGYTADDQLARSVQMGEFAALAEFMPTRLLRKATSTAIAVAQGRDVPRRVELPIAFHDSPENTGVGAPLLKGRDRFKAKSKF